MGQPALGLESGCCEAVSGDSRIGLSKLHNSGVPVCEESGGNKNFGRLVSYEGGTLFELESNVPGGGGTRGALRGEVQGFSDASRRRLMKMLASLNQKKIMKRGRPIFITLTYPSEFAGDWETWKRDLDNFLRWLFYGFDRGRMSVVWRLEVKDRSGTGQKNVPHFHLIVFGRRFIHHEKVAVAWNRLVAPGDHDHLSACCNVVAIRSWNGVMTYASKYMAKVDEGQVVKAGRMWGVRKPERLDITRSVIPLSRLEYKRLRSLFVDHLSKAGKTLTVFALSPLLGLYVFADASSVSRWLEWSLKCPF